MYSGSVTTDRGKQCRTAASCLGRGGPGPPGSGVLVPVSHGAGCQCGRGTQWLAAGAETASSQRRFGVSPA